MVSLTRDIIFAIYFAVTHELERDEEKVKQYSKAKNYMQELNLNINYFL